MPSYKVRARRFLKALAVAAASEGDAEFATTLEMYGNAPTLLWPPVAVEWLERQSQWLCPFRVAGVSVEADADGGDVTLTFDDDQEEKALWFKLKFL